MTVTLKFEKAPTHIGKGKDKGPSSSSRTSSATTSNDDSLNNN